MSKNLFQYTFAVTLISLSIIPLTTNSIWGKQLSSKHQQIESKVNATASKSQIAQLIQELEKRSINTSSKAARDASEELVRTGKPAIPQLIEALKKNQALLTVDIGKILSNIAINDASVAQILIDKLGDKNLNIRFAVATMALEDNKFENVLKKTAQDNKNPLVRSSAILSLKDNLENSKSLIPIFKTAFNDVNPTVRTSAAISLANHSGMSSDVLAVIKNGLKDDDSFIRIFSAGTLIQKGIETTSLAPVIVDGLKDENSTIRFTSVNLLSRITKENPQVVSEIIKVINNEQDAAVRYTAIDNISNMTKQQKVAAVPALVKAVEDKNEHLRVIAIRTLGNIGSDAKAVQPELLVILRNKQESDEIRGAAAQALGQMGKYGQSAIPVLVSILKDKQSSKKLVQDTIWALGSMEKHAKSTMPVLINILEDKQSNEDLVTYPAALALKKIDSQAFIPYLVKRLTDTDFINISLDILSGIALTMKENKDSYSQAELTKATSQFETALKIIDNSETALKIIDNSESPFRLHQNNQDRINSLQESVAVLKR